MPDYQQPLVSVPGSKAGLLSMAAPRAERKQQRLKWCSPCAQHAPPGPGTSSSAAPMATVICRLILKGAREVEASAC